MATPTLLQRFRERLQWLFVPAAVREELRVLNETVNLLDRTWLRLTGSGHEEELTAVERAETIEASYYYWQRDPLMGRAVQLIRDYTFGRGVSWKAKDDRVRKVLTKFWKDRTNRILAKAVGQWELSERLQLAGEVFFVFFVNPYTGHVKVRVVEPQEITQVIRDPDDRETRLYYERQWTRQAFSWDTKQYTGAIDQKKDYIPDWDNRNPVHETASTPKTRVFMHYIKINSHSGRGIPLGLRVLPWIKAYKGFMEDRATITLASATYAFKQKIKGSAAAVARMAAQWGARIAGRYGGGETGKERREGAQTLIENEAVSLEQMQFDTRSANAYTDGRMLRQQVSAGTGITEQNLTGDPSVANLASATQMEGPMLKMFESWQQLWKDEISDIFEFVIRMAELFGPLRGLTDLDRTVEVNFPPIVIKDLPTIINAVAQLISAQTMAGKEYITHERLAGYVLDAFGETDVDAAVAELRQTITTPSGTAGNAGRANALPDDQADRVQAAIEALRALAPVLVNPPAGNNGDGRP